MASDLAIVGGGIVGLATALEFLTLRPGASVVLLEKELSVGRHQTSHNSGVIHSGIYYRPGSMKARTCVAGARRMVEFCAAERIPHRICGKLIVAATDAEAPALKTLHARGVANGVAGVALIGPQRMRELEPHAQGVQALHVPSAGIVDYGVVAQAMARRIAALGGVVRTGAELIRGALQGSAWSLETRAGTVEARYLVTCAGLQADRVAARAGHLSDVRIAPFRGEYYDVAEPRRSLVRAMIYPVPDPALPFLGVHFTRSITGGVHAGPNAVLAWKREGYRKSDMDARDVAELLTFPGVWRMGARYWRPGLSELYRSCRKAAFVRALQRLVPEIRAADLAPGGSGVRAQALSRDGSLLDDFDLLPQPRALHVRNVPSPAATASLEIGRVIAGTVIKESA